MTFNSFATPKNVKPIDIFAAAAYNVNNPDNVVLDDIIERRGDTMLNLKTLREGQHLTQQQLAEKTGIRQGDISKLEHGNGNPSLRTLQRLADGLGMKLNISFSPLTQQE